MRRRARPTSFKAPVAMPGRDRLHGRAYRKGAKLPHGQKGVSIVTAIFLIVVLASLAGYAASLFRVQQQSSGLDVQGSRAYAAAQSGIDWGAYQALRSGSCVLSSNLAMPAGPLSAFSVTVECTRTTHCEGATCPPDNVTMYQLTSTACNQPTGGGVCPNGAPGDSYIERRVTATVEN